MIYFGHMKIQTIKLPWLILVFMVGTLIWVGNMAAKNNPSPQPFVFEKNASPQQDNLPDLISMSVGMDNRSMVLKKEIEGLADISSDRKELDRMAKETNHLSLNIKTFKKTQRYGADKLFDIRAQINQKKAALQELIQSTNEAINQAELWKKEWVEEGPRWEHLQATLSRQETSPTLATAFAKVHKTITTSQTLITQAIEPLLSQLQAAQTIRAAHSSLELELDYLASVLNDNLLHKTARSMFSSRYYSQLNNAFWKELPKSLHSISRPDMQFFQQQGWLIFIQILFSLVLTLGIFQQRNRLLEREQWRFIACRPIEAGIFVAAITTSLFYGAVPGTWRLLSQCVVILSLARLVDAFVQNLYKRSVWIVYGLSGYLITIRLFEIFALPLPLFRLYIFSTALTGLFICHQSSATRTFEENSVLYIQALRLGFLLFLLIVIAEMGGYSTFSVHLLESSLKTILVVLAGWMLIVMLHGFLEWVLCSPPFKRIPFLEVKTPVILSRSALLANLFAATLTGTFILVVWRVYDNPAQAIQAVWSFGITAGARHITIGLVLMAAAILYGAFFVSWTVQAMLMEGVFTSRQLQVGVRMSMARLIHYGFVFAGFLLALVSLGVQVRDFTIIAGALGVGIGFGLQSIINNFVSGLILLFERPIKVGDYIEIGGHQAEIKKIGLRATVIRTFERSEIVVPNSDLVSNQITNLTLSDQYTGIKIPMKVSHGSDVPLVMQTLLECAGEQAGIAEYPAPQVFFSKFGESSLNFELLVWLAELDALFQIKSELYQEIDRKFRLRNILVPFPQQDLHLHMTEKSSPATPAESKRCPHSPFVNKGKSAHVF